MKSFSATTEKGRDVTIMADYIDKEAALSLVQPDAPEDEKAAVTIATAKKLVRSIIQRAPAADVAPVRHGRWEPYFEEVEIYNAGGFAERKQTGWICGRCKSVESITRHYKTNYCPNCGAKME